MIRVGTAGWSLPAAVRDRFPPGDSLLQRYAQVLGGVEINSSFYRPHRRATYQRWAAATPQGFAFAVKAPRAITHEQRLADVDAPVARFLDEASGLGSKLGCVLLQLPPSLAFDEAVAAGFFALWRARFDGDTALEPRHPSWFMPQAQSLLIAHRIARVAADPAVVAAAAAPGGWEGFHYYRLHGAPKVYASAYTEPALTALAAAIGGDAWVVFDNTQFGAASENALFLQAELAGRRGDLSAEPPHAR